MVKLTRIYTRGGDGGETSLGDGTRLAKNALRPVAYGAVDEANAAIGMARLHAEGESDAALLRIQNDLFDLGADLCTPEQPERPERPDSKRAALRITKAQIDWLEGEIDRLNAGLSALSSFVLPGGTALAAHLHGARTTVRRAEREITALAKAESVNPFALSYANRLSDYLFVLARHANGEGVDDVLWIPGANR